MFEMMSSMADELGHKIPLPLTQNLDQHNR